MFPAPETPITPLMLPADAPGVLMVGGVFDPPHAAHLRLPQLAREGAMPPGAWLVYVPAARSPHKPEGPAASDADRVAMLRLALADMPRAIVWTDEIDRAAPGETSSYWIDTIERARRAVPAGTPLRFLIGADQAAAFHRWHRPRDILRFAEPLVVLRDPIRSREALDAALQSTGAWTDADRARWRSWAVSLPLEAASSTDIRSALSRDDIARAAEVLPAPVLDYIRQRGLYR